jgi:transposase-like protein
MERPRRNHSATFKAKVTLAAIRGDRTLIELAEQFKVHPDQIGQWRTELLGSEAHAIHLANFCFPNDGFELS